MKMIVHFRRDFIVVSIYHRDLSSIIYEQVGVPSIGSLLSTIGGSAGLCLGMSILTFLVFFFIVKSLYYWVCCCDESKDEKGWEERQDKYLDEQFRASLRRKRKASENEPRVELQEIGNNGINGSLRPTGNRRIPPTAENVRDTSHVSHERQSRIIHPSPLLPSAKTDQSTLKGWK
ncbi:hypothetical protein PFISCL1PPCAC_2236, partial [Pristionchus fissidentatus]